VVQAMIRLGEDMGQPQRRRNRSLFDLERSGAEWSGTGLWPSAVMDDGRI
jgi:hypothetical protein